MKNQKKITLAAGGKPSTMVTAGGARRGYSDRHCERMIEKVKHVLLVHLLQIISSYFSFL